MRDKKYSYRGSFSARVRSGGRMATQYAAIFLFSQYHKPGNIQYSTFNAQYATEH
jgi:hypothetical protein